MQLKLYVQRQMANSMEVVGMEGPNQVWNNRGGEGGEVEGGREGVN